MNEVQKIKEALDPDLFVDMATEYQKRHKSAEIIQMPRQYGPEEHPPRKPPKPPQKKESEPDLGLRCTLAMFGVWVLTVIALV